MRSSLSHGWVDLEKLQTLDPPLGVVKVWETAFQDSFSRLNAALPRPAALLDVGGGHGPLYPLIDKDVRYVLLDLDAQLIAQSVVPEKILADATAMPCEDGAFDVVISISTAQYMSHEALIGECLRVLKPGGVLALHENGSYNPVIILARIYSWMLARKNPDLKRYNSTIKRYLNRPALPAGVKLEYCRAYGILSPISFALQLAGFGKLSKKLEPKLLRLDERILKLGMIRKFAWFRVFHIRKPLESAAP